MQMKKRKICTVMIITLLMLLWTSCKSTQTENQIKPVQVETHFPSPYDENGNAIVTINNDAVSMPLWYWLKITEYVIDVETNKELRK